MALVCLSIVRLLTSHSTPLVMKSATQMPDMPLLLLVARLEVLVKSLLCTIAQIVQISEGARTASSCVTAALERVDMLDVRL